jgi:hypothetical protein
MCTNEPLTLRSSKRLRRVMPFALVAALSSSLIVGTVSPAAAAVQQSARVAPISLVFSDNALPAAPLASVASDANIGGRHFALNAEKTNVSSQAPSTESAAVVRSDRGAAGTIAIAYDSSIDASHAIPAAAQNTTITVPPGFTLTITSSEVQFSMSPAAVNLVEGWLAAGEDAAEITGAILDLAGVPLADGIADIVAAAIGLFDDAMKICESSNGSLTITIPYWGLPTCSVAPLT